MQHRSPRSATLVHPHTSSSSSGGGRMRATSSVDTYATTTDSAREEEDDDSDANDEDDDHWPYARPTPRKRAKSVAFAGAERRASVSSPASSTSDHSATGTAPRRRRPSYLLQKEERDELVEQVRILEAQLDLLKIKAGIATVHDQQSIASMEAAKMHKEDEVIHNQSRLARLHSLVTRQLQTIPECSLSTYIHLPLDAAERRRILEKMKETKIRRAIEVGLDRLSMVDPLKPYKHDERWCTAEGKYHFHYFQVQQFEGLKSAQQIFDALLYVQNNLEISVSEMLGQLTLREDTEENDLTVFNQRIVTTGELGGTEELNNVGFARFFESYVPLNGSQFGVLTIDTVDEDDLHPYKPLERTRKDLQVVYTVTEHRTPESNELVVVLATNVFMTQLPPQFPLPKIVWDKLIENMPRWIYVMNTFLKESAVAFAASS